MGVSQNDLQGPFADQVSEVLATAMTMTEDEAILLSRLWETEEFDASEASYLDSCRTVQNALTATDRQLPLGWFEEMFVDAPWTHTTRALHAIADTVCAMLVRDSISDEVFESLTDPWHRAFQLSHV
jgi:hypothetical protein